MITLNLNTFICGFASCILLEIALIVGIGVSAAKNKSNNSTEGSENE